MNKKFFIFILFLMLIIPNTVLAYRIPCTTKNLNNLKNEAYSVNFTYDFKQDSEGKYYFEIFVGNLSPNLEVRYGNIMVTYNAEKEIQSVVTNEGGNVTYYFDIYAAEGTACDGHKVLSKSITLPKYNVYSEREECLEYEEFRLCNKWCKENIPNSAYFEDELAKYKLTIEKETVKPEKEETNIFEKLIDLYVENLIISIPVTVILVALIIFIIIRSIIRRKNRIKLDFKG